MKLFSGLLTLMIAIIISSVAAYFSVVGLAALFAATLIPVIIMGSSLEAGKFIATSWLHANWSNKNVSWRIKGAMTFMIFVLMAVTAIGVYGFLSKGHLEQEAPVEGLQLQVEQKKQRIDQLTEDNNQLLVKQRQLDSSIDSFLKSDKAAAGLKARNTQKSERAAIDKKIAENNQAINKLNDEMLPLKMESSAVQAKLGPVKYVAELFGYTDTGSAVRLIILMIMVAFDPFALLLLVSSTISLSEYFNERKAKKDEQDGEPIVPPVENLSELEPEVAPDPVKVEEPIAPLDPHPDFGEAPEGTVEAQQVVVEAPEPAPVVEEPMVVTKPKKTRKSRKDASRQSMDDYQAKLRAYVAHAYGDNPQITDEQLLDNIASDVENKGIADRKEFINFLEHDQTFLENLIDVIQESKNNENKEENSSVNHPVDGNTADTNAPIKRSWL